MNWVIRRAIIEDVPILAQIESESFARPHWSDRDFLRYHTIVAEVEKQIAGFLVSRQIYEAGETGKAEREILNLAVAPAYRRLGAATALLRYELRRGATHYLEVRESNVAARKLYQKLGFEELSRRDGYYDHPIERAIVMKLK